MIDNPIINKFRPLICIDKTIGCPRCESHIKLGRLLRVSIEKNRGHFVFYTVCENCGDRIELRLPFLYDRKSCWIWDSDYLREGEEEGDDAI